MKNTSLSIIMCLALSLSLVCCEKADKYPLILVSKQAFEQTNESAKAIHMNDANELI